MKRIKLGMPTLMEFDSVKANIEVAKELNFDFLELNINMLYCFPDKKFREMMLNYKNEYKIGFTMHYYDTVDVSSPNLNYQNYLFKDFKELAENLDGVIDRVILHIEPGAFMTILSEKRYVYKYDKGYVSRTIEILKKIRNLLSKHNISLMLENVPIHPFMEDLYKTLGDNNFMFCWDIGHDVIYQNKLFSRFKEKYNLNVRHMHMHNVDDSMDHQELLKGQLDIDEYTEFATTNEVDVVIEVKDLENLKKSMEYFN